MFTENEVAAIVADNEVKEKVVALRKEFVKAEAPFLEIDDHDFLSLLIMTPSVGIALANGSVSLFEEMALNKKARKLSKGGYFMKKDPVVVAMGFFIKKYDDWQDKFYEVLRFSMERVIDKPQMITGHENDEELSDEEFCLEGLRAPFLFIRCLTSFFMNEEDEDIVRPRSVSKVEHERIVDIGHRLAFDDIPLFKRFLATFKVK